MYISQKKIISLAKGKKQREFASDLNDPNQQNEIFLIAKQNADGKRKTRYNRVKLSERCIR